MVTEAVTDGVRSALRAMETGREAAEDAIRDAERMTKRNPKQALGIAFVAGAALCGADNLDSGARAVGRRRRLEPSTSAMQND